MFGDILWVIIMVSKVLRIFKNELVNLVINCGEVWFV